MNSPTFPEKNLNQAERWGWQHPECRGPAALSLFIDDLHRILQTHIAGKLAHSSTLAQAQQDVNTLLQHYNRVAAAPDIFHGQSVTLKEGFDRHGLSHTVPIFSPHLKKSLSALLD